MSAFSKGWSTLKMRAPGIPMTLRFGGKCANCGYFHPAGTRAHYNPRDKRVYCPDARCGIRQII